MSVQRYNPSNVFLIEMIPGFFGFLGVGYLYVGRTEEGIKRLIIFLVGIIIGWVAAIALSVVVIGLCLMPALIAAQIGIPIWSAIQLRRSLEAQVEL